TQRVKEIRKVYSKESYVETIEQFNRSKDVFVNIKSKDTAYIAPTSFGKSSIIRDVIIQNEFNRIAIIVPTKSLIIQTYNDIRKLDLNYKLILHDEMFNGEEKFIGILTQERATRLVNKNKISFDILVIDEAHNLLNNNSRNLLLSRLIMLNYKNNNTQRLLYLSPLISDISNLKIKNTSEGQIFESTIKHNLKTYDVLFLDKKGKLSNYNRFTDELYNIANNYTFTDYIIDKSKEKNFIYNYRPKYVEEIASEINKSVGKIIVNKNLSRVSNVISREISEDIDIVQYVLNGIIYLHGKLPNILKEYLEFSYKEITDFKYIIANSVILEGINFPIDNLYITSTYGLNVKGLNNLIGRVNRLNYVFKDSLEKIISDIHFVDSDSYTDSRSNMINKITLLREHTLVDENKNPLLENYKVENLKLSQHDKVTRVIKDKKIIDSTDFLINSDPKNIEGKIKITFIENNIDEFYRDYEKIIAQIIKNISNISDRENVILTIYEVFVKNLELEIKDYELERLKNEKARNYYKYYIDVFQLLGIKEKIGQTLKYFGQKSNDKNDSYLFIGSSFGEIVGESDKYKNREYQQPVYINLDGKTKQQLANISLIKIRIEEDFVSFKLKKLITFLYEFDLISEQSYYLATYGSTDIELINLTRIGLNPNIAKVLKENTQIKNVQFDKNGNLISNEIFKDFMLSQSELFNFEVNKYIK
ncbi:DEAD/DEAH box helicase, partial [Flavobacterium psychrophilum]|nr:DEAD/DEAH box helicase [Flavobacterium psychrophilum]